jgi:outer membrane protein OmpA-like peptidoglycan-associated protein
MRNRHLLILMALLLAVVLAPGCAHKMAQADKDRMDSIGAKIVKAEQMGAKECAPKELAYAKVERDNAYHEASEFWEHTGPFYSAADKAADEVLAKTIPCWQAKQVKPAPAAPTVSLSANPATVEAGKCATLAWSSTNATGASIEPGIGSVGASGSREVCPDTTTKYTITASGPGGSQMASETVNVTPKAVPPPPPPAAKVIDRLAIHVNFDTAKSDIRKADLPELQKAIDFVKKYPENKISIEGHTDSRGAEKYNQALSERRAAAVKDYLVKHGNIKPENIKSAGFGESKPIADNKTKKGQFENRRVEILILSD